MSAIGKVIVGSTVGLAILAGLLTSALALPKLKTGVTYCGCECSYRNKSGAWTSGNLYWEKVGACSLAENKACKYTDSTGTYAGTLRSCMDCQADAAGGILCQRQGSRIQRPDGVIMNKPPSAIMGQ